MNDGRRFYPPARQPADGGGGTPLVAAAARALATGADSRAVVLVRQRLVTTGIEDAVGAAREAADGKDVVLMGGGVVTEALKAGLVGELVLHQVPILLGAGDRGLRRSRNGSEAGRRGAGR